MTEQSILNKLLVHARAAYEAMSPEQKAQHDYNQRRSFVRGMCPDSTDINVWNDAVDKMLPPIMPPPDVPLAWVIGKLKKIANTGQSIEPDHWKFRCMARETAQEILDKIERR
jgi:hypothetical protein